jgi:LacI family repressor for deo operon, udp, cdd, tsx, nupC, and nupG
MMEKPARPRGQRQEAVNPASIKDVARIAGVSIATVSRCINDPERVKEKTRNRVQAAVLQTGYSPNTLAQSFRRGKTHVIMVVLPSVGDPFFTRVMSGIRSVASAKGYSLLISETQFNTMTADEVGAMIVSRQADGIALLASLSPFGTEVLSSRSHRTLPIVIGCETISTDLAGFPGVHIDNSAAALEATNYLLARGHRKIAFIYGQKESLLTADREKGYRTAMQEANIAIEDGWVAEGKLTIEGAIRATRELLDHHHRPTAIFCANDEMAMACIHAIKSAGLKVPGDVSVIGFDDIRYAPICDPPLTTVYQPAEEIGKRVMYQLLDEIEQGGNGENQTEIVSHKLIIRQSVTAPPG